MLPFFIVRYLIRKPVASILITPFFSSWPTALLNVFLLTPK